MIICISALSVVTPPFSLLILLIWFFSLFFLMCLTSGLPVLFIFSKKMFNFQTCLLQCTLLLLPQIPIELKGEPLQRELQEDMEKRKVKVKSLSRFWLFATPQIIAHGIFQARLLEWVAIFFSKGSSWPRDQTQVSHIAGRGFTSEPPGRWRRIWSNDLPSSLEGKG